MSTPFSIQIINTEESAREYVRIYAGSPECLTDEALYLNATEFVNAHPDDLTDEQRDALRDAWLSASREALSE